MNLRKLTRTRKDAETRRRQVTLLNPGGMSWFAPGLWASPLYSFLFAFIRVPNSRSFAVSSPMSG